MAFSSRHLDYTILRTQPDREDKKETEGPIDQEERQEYIIDPELRFFV
jgi:hypothetical protein